MDIHGLLRQAMELGASDLHLVVEAPPMVRINGKLAPLGERVLSPSDTAEVLEQLLAFETRRADFEQTGQIDFAYSLPGVGRFRVNGFRQRGSVGLAIRFIPFRVPDLEELALPPAVASLALKEHGLVLVTGPTGSGKSTTLAAMIQHINRQRSGRIITLEDPIEYLHRHDRCIVTQREIGVDSASFAGALRAALRQDPDVILVGELRDHETIATAVTAAETGHLVLATLHTGSAAGAVDRLVDVFPAHQQQQIRVQLAAILQGVITQRLLPRRDGQGRVAAVEVLLATPAVRNLIREGKAHQLVSVMQMGARNGMRLMADAVAELVSRGLVSPQEAELARGETDARV